MSMPSDPTSLLRKGLNLLIVFDVVAEMRSVTAAAERLSLTQSALSHALLFLRTPTGLVLTPRAEALVTPIRELLYSAESLLQPEAFDPATFDKEVRLGISECSLFQFDGLSLVRLREAAPLLRFWIDTPDGDGERKLQEGVFDLGAWYADHVSPSLHSIELFEDRYVGIVHADHPLANAAPRVTLEDYLRFPHLRIDLPGMRKDPVDTALAGLEARRSIRITASFFLAAFPPLAHAALIATVPSRFVAPARRMGFEVATFELPFETTPLTYRLFWSERTNKDPAGIWLREMLAESLAAEQAPADT